jgi:hypothetical protein
MTAAIRIATQSLEIEGVGDVVITDAVQDPQVGDYVRDIRIYNASTASTDAVAQLLVQLRLRATTRDALDIAAPIQRF